MDRDIIIALAYSVAAGQPTNGWEFEFDYEQLELFAKLVSAAEREACARLCDEYIDSASDHESGTASGIQEAIRARGQ